MPKIHIIVPDDLLARFKAAAEAKEHTVSSQLRVLMKEFVAGYSSSPLGKASAKSEEAARIAAIKARNKERNKQEWRELLVSGRAANEDQIRTSYVHFNTPKAIAEYDAILAELMTELRAEGWKPAY